MPPAPIACALGFGLLLALPCGSLAASVQPGGSLDLTLSGRIRTKAFGGDLAEARLDRSVSNGLDLASDIELDVLAKAEDAATALKCLELLGGRRHKVIGGIAIAAPDGRRAVRVVTTAVIFKRLDATEEARYIDSGEWHGKAGGYAIQGRAAAFIPEITGSYSNVVGLSLSDASAMLTGLGHRE